MGNTIDLLKTNADFGSAYLLVKATSNEFECQLTSDPTDDVIGVTQKDPQASGDKICVIPAGSGQPTKLIAQGSIAKDEPICPSGSTNGAARGAAGDLNCNVVGYALHAAADGESFLAALDRRPSVLKATVGSETSNAIAVDLQLNGLSGAGGAKKYLAEVFDANMVASSNTTLAETGDGAEVSATGQDKLIFTLSSAGAAQITVTDGSGTLTATEYLVLTPLNHDGPKVQVACTFA